MSQEKLKVLEMLKDGIITTEEALALLKGVETERGNGEAGWSFDEEDRGNRRNYDGGESDFSNTMDFSWINDIKESIVESAKNISRYVSEQGYPYIDFGLGAYNSKTLRKDVANGIESLKIAGKNDRIEIATHKEDVILIEADYKSRHGSDAALELENINGHFTFSYNDHAVYSMRLNVKVPERLIDNISIENKNATVAAKGLMFNKGLFVTKNASIKMTNMKGKALFVETKNAPVELEYTETSEIELRTTNAKINVFRIDADTAIMQTSNSTINTDCSDIRQIIARTSNAGLKFSNLQNIADPQSPSYSLEAYTTNGVIKVEVPAHNIPCRIKASTSNGYVNTYFDDLQYLGRGKSYIDAKTADYDNAPKTLNLYLQTSNSSINVTK